MILHISQAIRNSNHKVNSGRKVIQLPHTFLLQRGLKTVLVHNFGLLPHQSWTRKNTYEVVSIAKPTDPCFSEKPVGEQSVNLIITGLMVMRLPSTHLNLRVLECNYSCRPQNLNPKYARSKGESSTLEVRCGKICTR